MANKPQGKNWSEIQLAIAALGIAAMLWFWNLFSVPAPVQASVLEPQTATPPPAPTPTEVALPTAPVLALRPVKIIYGGQAPQQTVIQVAAAQPKVKKPKGGNAGDSGGGGSAPAAAQPPAPAASTGSS